MFKNKKETSEKSKDKKILKIVLTAVISVLLISAITVVSLHYIKSAPEIQTEYGTLKNIDIDNETGFTVNISAPYSEKNVEYIADDSVKCVLRDEKDSEQYETSIKEIKYESLKNDDIQKGTVSISFDVKNGFKFTDGAEYVFEMPDKTVTEKKTGVSVGSVKVKLAVGKAGDRYFATLDTVTQYEQKQTSISKVAIEKEDNGYFLVLTLNETQTVDLNEEGLKKHETGITYSYKKDAIELVTVFDAITSAVDNSSGTVTLKCPIKNDDVIPGTEYVVFASKGLLMNGDSTIGSAEMTETFTYMG